MVVVVFQCVMGVYDQHGSVHVAVVVRDFLLSSLLLLVVVRSHRGQVHGLF